MWGAEGTGGPSCTTVMPRSQRGPDQQQRADELRRRRGVDGDRAARPARRDPAPRREGPRARRRRPSHRGAGAPRGPARGGARGRGGRRRRPPRRRPARPPAAGSASPCRRCPRRPRRARSAAPASPSTGHCRGRSIPTPSAVSPAAMSEVSRARSAFSTRAGPSASPASTRARFVIDFEPGTVTVASTGPGATGAGQTLDDPGQSSRRTPGRKPRASSPPRNRSLVEASTSSDHDALVALGGVDHLEVGDVHAELGGQREHLGRGAGAVGDGDAHLGQVLGLQRRGTAGWRGPRGPGSAW